MAKNVILTEKEILHVAELARLTIKQKELGKFRNQLSDIFNYINQIGEMKTGKVSETSQVTGVANRFRKDLIDTTRILSQEEALSNAKRKHDGFFVAKVIFK